MNKEELIDEVKKYVPYQCHVEIKSINRNLIQVKKNIFKTYIFIHPVFLKGDKNIVQDLIHFILQKNRSRLLESKKRLSHFYEQNYTPKSVRLNHDFHFQDMKTFFENIIISIEPLFTQIDFQNLKITWGKRSKKPRKTIRFGSYDNKRLLVRLNPQLDRPDVPEFFIKSIIYHEVTHYICFQLFQSKSYHNNAFYQLLKKIDPNYEKSLLWEEKNKGMFFKQSIF